MKIRFFGRFDERFQEVLASQAWQAEHEVVEGPDKGHVVFMSYLSDLGTVRQAHETGEWVVVLAPPLALSTDTMRGFFKAGANDVIPLGLFPRNVREMLDSVERDIGQSDEDLLECPRCHEMVKPGVRCTSCGICLGCD